MTRSPTTPDATEPDPPGRGPGETGDVIDDDQPNPVDALAEDFVRRLRRGESPQVQDVVAAHPELKEEIEAVFPTLLLVERAKRQSTSPAIPVVPERLGDFKLVRELGRGGMGIVYEAFQASLGRRVALKVLGPHATRADKARERFQREAQAAAALHHPNIVAVFGTGEQDGQLYYVMELIDGRSLEDLLPAGRPLEARRAARIALQAAAGLGHAHSRGVIHRDVKPANILVGDGDAVWVADFGLAKVVGDSAGLTETGDVLGTLRYLPPERLEGKADARGDVYGLGLVLHEMLTGAPAHTETDRAALLRAIRDLPPPPPRSLRPDLPRDLETIVLKATRREPEDRYPTAAAMEEDLRRWLEDRPITARRASLAERAWRWGRRNRALAALSVLLVAALAAAAATGLAGWAATTDALHRESERRAEAEAATRRAEENERLSLEALEGIFDALAGDEEQPLGRGGGGGAENNAGNQAEEARLLQTVLAFYDGFAARSHTEPRLRLEAARAHRRVALLRARLGDPAAAEAAFAQAIERVEALLRDAPLDATFRLELATTLLDAAREEPAPPGAVAPVGTTSPAIAAERAGRALTILEGLPAAVAERPELFVAARARRAVALARLGREADARAELELAIAARDAARRAEAGPELGPLPGLGGPPPGGPGGPPPDERRRGSALGLVGGEVVRAREALADLLLTRGDHGDALPVIEAALAEASRSRGAGRGSVQHLLEQLAACHRGLGNEPMALEVERLLEEARRAQRQGQGRGGGRGGRPQR